MEKNNIMIGAILFEDTRIRVIYSGQQSVEWVCLNDLLKPLDRIDMIENGQAMRLCKTAVRIPFKEGGRNRWGVKPYDIHNLLRAVRSDNARISKICDRLQNWANSLPVASVQSRNTYLPVLSGEPVTFTYKETFPNISFKADNGRIYVNATQMAKGFSKMPTVWLKLASTTDFREALVRDGKSLSFESQVIARPGHYGSTWIEEPLAIEFARWLSPEFSDWCNDRIKELGTKGYVTFIPQKKEYTRAGETSSGNFPVPQNFEEALMLAAEQARKIREDEPKVAFYEEYVEERDHFKSSRIADELEISTVQLHKFLSENNIIQYENRKWVVRSPYQALQCDVPYMWSNGEGKVYPFGSVKRWTQAGREYIIELWRSKHPER